MEISGNTSDLRDCGKTSTPCSKTMKAKKIRWMNKFKLHPRMHTHTVYHVQFTFSITCLMCIHVKTSCKLKTHVTVRMLWICVFFFGGGLFLFTLVVFFGTAFKNPSWNSFPKNGFISIGPWCCRYVPKNIYGGIMAKNLHFMVDLPIVYPPRN